MFNKLIRVITCQFTFGSVIVLIFIVLIVLVVVEVVVIVNLGLEDQFIVDFGIGMGVEQGN